MIDLKGGKQLVITFARDNKGLVGLDRHEYANALNRSKEVVFHLSSMQDRKNKGGY
jgi:hypothetical protein